MRSVIIRHIGLPYQSNLWSPSPYTLNLWSKITTQFALLYNALKSVQVQWTKYMLQMASMLGILAILCAILWVTLVKLKLQILTWPLLDLNQHGGLHWTDVTDLLTVVLGPLHSFHILFTMFHDVTLFMWQPLFVTVDPRYFVSKGVEFETVL